MKNKISEVYIYKLRESKGKHVGYVSCLFNDSLKLNNIALLLHEDGNFELKFPTKIIVDENGKQAKDAKGKPIRDDYPYFYPITRALAEELLERVVEKANLLFK